MEYIVGIALIVIVVIIIALLLRKRLYDTVDRLETWKVDIMNRNIAAELSRMKELNLTGETLENFDTWKDRWELIVTDDLADVEVSLFDSEAYADRYKFSSARKSLNDTEAKLVKIEADLDSILTQLNELLETEESSRKGVEELRPAIKVMEEDLAQNEHLYGRGALRFEVEFEELNNALITYDDLVENGEYHQAKEIVDQVNEEIKRVQIEVEEYPDLYRLCKIDLPEQLKELITGQEEMKIDGYPVDRLGFKDDIRSHQAGLLEAVRTMEENNLEQSKEIIPKIEESVQKMYDLLEKEVAARKFLESQLPVYKQELEIFEAAFTHTQEEIMTLREAYYFADEDLEKIKILEKRFEELKNQEESLLKQVEEKTEVLAKLQAQLEDAFNQLEQLEIDHQTFNERIHMLRKDEIEAREKLADLQNELLFASRRLRTNNLPGVPEFIWERIDEAEHEREKVVAELSKTPLNIKGIQTALSKAEVSVNAAKEEIELVVEQAYLTEQVIQYANRYRSSNPQLAESLVESEKLFRSYDYELALETAASAVESVEPGALKSIEAQQEYI